MVLGYRATSHMDANAGNFSSSLPLTRSSPILVGNGSTMPVTHTASTDIATTHSLLHLNNILVSPSLVKNLISVHSLTRDNNVTIEFDPFSFSIKDIPTRMVIIRCNSADDMYPLASSSLEALVTANPSVDMWLLPLGHPGHTPSAKPYIISTLNIVAPSLHRMPVQPAS